MIDGVWVLIVYVSTGPYQIETYPLTKYEDMGFAYYECQQDKANYTKTLVQKYKFACVRESDV